MSQTELRNFRFHKGSRLMHTIECDWVEVRRAGNELADEIGAVTVSCYNAPMRRWEMLGTFHGGMRYTNAWGERCVIRPDFTGLDFANKESKK